MTDQRPINCRFRLMDEGKAYPRSSCTACGKSVINGLGVACSQGASNIDLRPGSVPDPSPWPLAGAKFIAAPLPEWGAVVSMVEHNGILYVACQYRVLMLVGGALETVMIVGGHE